MKHDNVYVPEENPNSSKYTLRENVPEDGRHKSNHNPHLSKALNSSYWKIICIVLFFVALSLECINVALTSRCENGGGNEQTLGRFLSAITQQKSLLASLQYVDTTTNGSTTPANIGCVERREFHLQVSDKRINICTYQNEVRVDIRQFINNRPTVKGIYFTPREFLGVTEVLSHVRTEILRQMEILRLSRD